MALDQSALLDLLAQLKLTPVSDRIRLTAETLFQQLIDAEAEVFIGPPRFSARLSAAPTATGHA